MPLDIPFARHVQGHFDNTVARNLRSRGVPRQPLPNAFTPLTVRNGRDWVLSALALSSAMALARVPQRGPALAPGPAAPDRVARQGTVAPALLPGAQAQGGAGYQAVPVAANGPTAPAAALGHIANTATLSCVARPSECPRTLAAATIAAATVITSAAAGGVLGFVLGRESALDANNANNADRTPAPASLPLTLYDLLPDEHRHRLLEIVRDCGTDAAACTGPAIRSLLQDLPEATRRQIMVTLGVARQAETHGHGGWPSGAEAAALAPMLSWVDWAAELLGSVVSPAQARFELDLEQIAQATLDAQQPGMTGAQREVAANIARFDTLRALFRRDGHTLQQLPFSGSTRDSFGFDQTYNGCNLMLEFAGAGTPQRTLMVLAHGDMTGARDGSSGASDNGTGLTTLLALARKLAAQTLPGGTRVQLMVTDLEEHGMLGAKAYAEQCLAQASCPDVALNLDMTGRGDGMTLSGSDRHHLYMDGDSRALQPPPAPVTAHEAQLRGLLESAAAAVGLTVHDSARWVLQSDQIALQREGVPALGMNLADAADIPLERDMQQARARLWVANADVDWSRFEHYLNGTLGPEEAQAMETRMDAMEHAMNAYKALPLSPALARIHNRQDQLGQVDPRRAMAALAVVEGAIDAWLHAPAP
jgi:hypothetical protein